MSRDELLTPHEVHERLTRVAGDVTVTVALDAAGGDNAPAEIVKGALAVVGERLRVLLVGPEERLRSLSGVAGNPFVDVVHAPDVIGASDEPTKAVRGKPDSSLVMTARLVAEGRADACVSAGNTGAVVVAGLLHVRRMKGVLRPAICQLMPAVPLPVVLLDVGANAEVRPEHLRQFAVMGQVFASEVVGLHDPEVGLLSIGEEPTKGTPVVIEAHKLLSDDPAINFYGNVEGYDIMARVRRRDRDRRLQRQRGPQGDGGDGEDHPDGDPQRRDGFVAGQGGSPDHGARSAPHPLGARPRGLRRLVPPGPQRPRRDRPRQLPRAWHRQRRQDGVAGGDQRPSPDDR